MLDLIMDHWIISSILGLYLAGGIAAKVIGLNWVVAAMWPIFLIAAGSGWITIQ